MATTALLTRAGRSMLFHVPYHLQSHTHAICRWEDVLITKDQATFNGNAQDTRLAHATSRDTLAESGSRAQAAVPPSLAEDIDFISTAPELTAAPPMFSLYSASAIPVDIPEDAMDGDVELSSLGDVARTMESGR